MCGYSEVSPFLILSAATLHRCPNLFPEYDHLEYVPGHLGAIVSAQI